MKVFLVTGGLGFIASHFIIDQVKKGNKIINLDKVTYAANYENLKEIEGDKNYIFQKGDIKSQDLVEKLIFKHKIDYLINFAAESHVDNSINCAKDFIETNIVGTYSLLEASRKYYESLDENRKQQFRFLHVSTDEVYGSLKEGEPAFTEENRYLPNSPYSASKASSDHLVRAWFETYKLPTIITNCSNNYGPHQHQEKLIPTIIRNAISNKDIPIYGNGKNIRDWIYVKDHCLGIELALLKGKIGQTYCFGGQCEMRNIEIAEKICEILDNINPRSDSKSYKAQIKFVEDRKGHDYRYSIDNSKSRSELGFSPTKDFKQNIIQTINYYLALK